MRIALVCHYLPPHQGGIEHVVARLADHYAAAGVDPVLVAWGGERAARQHTPHRVRALRGWNGLERHHIPVPIVEPVSSWRRLAAAIAGSDGVHVHGLPYPACALALIQAHRLGRPAIVTEHVGTVPYDSAVVRAVQAVALRVTAAIAKKTTLGVAVLNDRVGEELAPLVAPLTVTKVPNGVDTDLFSPVDPERRAELRRHLGFDRPTVVSVGRNVPKKGFRHLVAATELSDTFDLFLVGAGTAEFASRRCRTVEHLSQPDLADVYRAADLLALASEGEGLPLVVQEALATGLPVVMGDDPAVRTELPDGPVAFVRPSDAAQVHDTICDLLGRPDLDALRQSAREEAIARYDWAQTAASYLRLLGMVAPGIVPDPATPAPPAR